MAWPSNHRGADGGAMDITIPSPERFRSYANAIRQFLQDMEEKYRSYRSLPFESAEEQRKTLDWLTMAGQIYRADLNKTTNCLASEFKDVDNYWAADPAYKLASRLVLTSNSDKDAFTTVTERITQITKSRPWRTIPFNMIRRRIEAELKWRQALALTIANYLDGTSYQIATELKPTASRIAELLTCLENELEKPEALHLLDLPDWPVMGT